jgi:hypothetical protein
MKLGKAGDHQDWASGALAAKISHIYVVPAKLAAEILHSQT